MNVQKMHLNIKGNAGGGGYQLQGFGNFRVHGNYCRGLQLSPPGRNPVRDRFFFWPVRILSAGEHAAHHEPPGGEWAASPAAGRPLCRCGRGTVPGPSLRGALFTSPCRVYGQEIGAHATRVQHRVPPLCSERCLWGSSVGRRRRGRRATSPSTPSRTTRCWLTPSSTRLVRFPARPKALPHLR